MLLPFLLLLLCAGSMGRFLEPVPFDRMGTVNMTHCQPLDNNGICDLECDLADVHEVEDCRLYPKETDSYTLIIRPSIRLFTFERIWGSVVAELRCIYTARVRLETWKEIYPEGTDPTDMSLSDGFLVEARLVIEVEQGMPLNKEEFVTNADNLMMGRPSDRKPSNTAYTLIEIVGGVFVLSGVLFGALVSTTKWKRTRKTNMIHAQVWAIPKAAPKGSTMKRDNSDSDYATPSVAPYVRPPLTDITNRQLAQAINGSISLHRPLPPTKYLRPQGHDNYASLTDFDSTQQPVQDTVEEEIQPEYVPNHLHCLITSFNTSNLQSVLHNMDHVIRQQPELLEMLNREEETPLLMAVRMNFHGCAEKLLQHGADPNTMDKLNRTPLHHAVANMDLEMVQLLVKDTRICNKVVDDRRAIDAVNKRDQTALMVCAEFSWRYVRDIVEALLEAGADPRDAGDKASTNPLAEGRTALHWAALYGNREMADYLSTRFNVFRNNSGDELFKYINQEDIKGRTALYQAVLSKRLNVVELLLSKGASPTIKDQMSVSPIDLANRMGLPEFERVLVAAKDDPRFAPVIGRRRRSGGKTPDLPAKRQCGGSTFITPPDSATSNPPPNRGFNFDATPDPYRSSQPVNIQQQLPPPMQILTPPSFLDHYATTPGAFNFYPQSNQQPNHYDQVAPNNYYMPMEGENV